MTRSSVLTGLKDQRDRARLRRRLDRSSVQPSVSAQQRLDSWLGEHLALDEAKLASLNLTSYLRDTGHWDLPPETRLTQLALHAEAQIPPDGADGWQKLDRIYREALRLAPGAFWSHYYRAASAMDCAEVIDESERTQVRRRLLDMAWSSAQQAEQLSGEENVAALSYLLGSLCYKDPDRKADEALHHFEAACTHDPGHAWARLYRAHCLHDLQRWREAAAAYAEVDAAEFVGPIAWRYELVQEQRAYCLLRAGDTAAAANEFLRLLERWTKAPELARDLLGQYITEAARGALRVQLLPGLRELVDGQEWDWLETP